MKNVSRLGLLALLSCADQGGAAAGTPTVPSPACTDFTYGAWTPAVCPDSKTQTRTVRGSTPSGCTGGTPVLVRTCSSTDTPLDAGSEPDATPSPTQPETPTTPTTPTSPPASESLRMARISPKKPAFASTGSAGLLVDGAYRSPNAWTFRAPAWGAVHVGEGPSTLLVDWSFQDGEGGFDTKVWGGSTIGSYVLEVSADSTNGSNGSWQVAKDARTGADVRVTGNTLIQRTHLVRFTGFGWIKLRIEASSAGSIDELDVWDASAGHAGTFFFHGDSITQRCGNMRGSAASYEQRPSFQSALESTHSGFYPLQVGGGIVGQSAADAVSAIPRYLAAFEPVRYWFLTMGTNDLCAGATTYATRAQSWIDAVKAAGHVPILVHPIWGNDVTSYCSKNGPAFNAAVDALVQKNGLLPPVPLYEATVGRADYFGEDDVHPSPTGCHAWNETFARYVTTTLKP